MKLRPSMRFAFLSLMALFTYGVTLLRAAQQTASRMCCS